MQKVRILLLAANPSDTTRLAVGEEYRAIDARIRASDARDRFEVTYAHEVRVLELGDALLRFTPDVVHFSGHGSEDGALLLPDESGAAQPVAPGDIADLFAILARDRPVRCVLLNACYSSALAERLTPHVDCVIGVPAALGDEAAVTFAGAFYQCLGYGRDVAAAVEFARNQVELALPAPGALPRLHHRPDVTPSRVRLLAAEAPSSRPSARRVALVAVPLALAVAVALASRGRDRRRTLAPEAPPAPVVTRTLDAAVRVAPADVASVDAAVVANTQPEGPVLEAPLDADGASVTQIALGAYGLCALREDGRLSCRARGRDAFETDDALHQATARLTGVTAISMGFEHGCAVADGRTVCFGGNHYSALGVTEAVRPDVAVAVGGLTDAVSVSAGSHYTCAVARDGRVSCWGANGSGQLGAGVVSTQRARPAVVPSLTEVAELAVASGTLCARLRRGAVACWGSNGYRQANGDERALVALHPSVVPVPSRVVQVGVGDEFACAVTEEGALWCWGHARPGVFGAGVSRVERRPVRVAGLDDVAQVAVSGNSYCVRLRAGEVRCARAYDEGAPATPHLVTVAGLGPARALVGAASVYCALTSQGAVRCWNARLRPGPRDWPDARP